MSYAANPSICTRCANPGSFAARTGNGPTNTPTNTLGLVGFVFSLVGLVFSLGLLCPIGLLLSFIALFKRPRGFALAGFIIGLIGSAWIIALVALGVLAIGIAAVGAHAVSSAMLSEQTQAGLHRVNSAIVAYEASAGRLPSTLEILPNLGEADLRDAWGQALLYEPRGEREFTLKSPGPDAAAGTNDDISFDSSWQPDGAAEAREKFRALLREWGVRVDVPARPVALPATDAV